jgi:hypothetical protein
MQSETHNLTYDPSEFLAAKKIKNQNAVWLVKSG